MAMPLGHFREEIVQPLVDEFENEDAALHRGFAAVSVVDALAAHIHREVVGQGQDPFKIFNQPIESRRDDTGFRAELAKLNPNFKILRDVAKANKHAFLTQGNNVEVNGSGDTAVVRMVYGEGAYGVGKYGGLPFLQVTTQSAEDHRLLDVVLASLKFLDEISGSLVYPIR